MKKAIRKAALPDWTKVKATGDYAADCRTGAALALEFLEFQEANEPGGAFLAPIIAKMPRVLSGVEIGFLEIVSFAAGAGAQRAREIVKFWESSEILTDAA
ncbi:hypothetical protein UB31_18905 [Bradyrhizobium sp. LTSP849]|uniref:hypothetical protein n=1 Tax=Bradyrhizobium sp. LTSP849 TaxID=1615890 RepID=UPI0005D2BE23|nr:hypothetical protein [Bradyrhizobium sp. LTSP849]KJC47325.1 hypothetical protein UB31_18905 [Bradyrhizobium sp. LTSP849]